MENRVKNEALQWYDCGVVPLPVVPGEKRAAIKWRTWQGRQPPRRLVAAWFGRSCNLALMCGTVSGGLCILDFDEMGLYEHWRNMHKHGLAGSYTVGTPRPGRHVYLFLDDVPERTDSSIEGLDIKSTGYCLAPPSVTADGGYQVLCEAPIMRATAIDLALVGMGPKRAENGGGSSCTVRVEIGGQGNAVTIGGQTSNNFRQFSAPSQANLRSTRLRPGIAREIKGRLSILDVCNWYTTMEGPGNGGYYWGLCPAHDDREPSFSCSLERGRAHCWSSGCRLHSGSGLDVIDLVQRLENLNTRDAMATLAIELGLVDND